MYRTTRVFKQQLIEYINSIEEHLFGDNYLTTEAQDIDFFANDIFIRIAMYDKVHISSLYHYLLALMILNNLKLDKLKETLNIQRIIIDLYRPKKVVIRFIDFDTSLNVKDWSTEQKSYEIEAVQSTLFDNLLNDDKFVDVDFEEYIDMCSFYLTVCFSDKVQSDYSTIDLEKLSSIFGGLSNISTRQKLLGQVEFNATLDTTKILL